MNCQGNFSNHSSSELLLDPNKESFKKQLIEKIIPEGKLRIQSSRDSNTMKMRLRHKSQALKRAYWLGQGFSKVEATFLAFHYVPKERSVEDCKTLVELLDLKELPKESHLQPTSIPKKPRVVVGFDPKLQCKDFNRITRKVQLTVQEEINKLPEETPVKIVTSYTEGDLYFVCENNDTKEWLENIIPTLIVKNSGEDMKLFTREVPAYPSKSVKIKGHIPCLEDKILTSEQILENLSNQNPLLVTNDWKTLESKTVATGIKMIFLIDIKHLDVMFKLNWSLTYNGKKARFELGTAKANPVFWDKIKNN